jgi:hypothetical protein
VDFDAVEAGLAGPSRALAEGRGDLAELSRCRALALEPVQRVGLRRRTQALGELDPRNVPLSATVRELEDVSTAVLVDALAELAPERDPLVAVDRGVTRDDQAAPVDAAPRRDDRADAAAREAQLPVDPRLRPGAVVAVEPAGDARPEDPVLDRQVAKPQGREDRVGYGDANCGGS